MSYMHSVKDLISSKKIKCMSECPPSSRILVTMEDSTRLEKQNESARSRIAGRSLGEGSLILSLCLCAATSTKRFLVLISDLKK